MTAEDILSTLGLGDADEAVQHQVLQQVVEAVEARFALLIDQLLTPEQADEFAALPQDDFTAVQSWLQATLPDAADAYNEVMRRTVVDIAKTMQQVL